MNSRTCLIVGALLAGLAVAAGTFGAHGLPDAMQRLHGITAESGAVELAKAEKNFETAARYQMYHALGLLLIGVWSARNPATALRVAASAFTFGVVVFSGCLYSLVLTQHKWLGAIVPIGGTAFLVGWVSLVAAAVHANSAGESP